MDDLERHLKDALAREEAPAGFEARVMSAVNQAAESSRGRARPRFGERPRWQWIFATAAAVVVIGVGTEWEHHAAVERVKAAHFEMEHINADREAGQAAKAQLQLALRITSTKLEEIQQRIGEGSQ